MSENKEKKLYLNFDEYIRQGEPQKKERAEAWRVAIGLQAVDGLKVSDYLLELARRNIEGEISMEEVDKLLDEYYEEKHRIRDTMRPIHGLMFIQIPKAVKGEDQYNTRQTSPSS